MPVLVTDYTWTQTDAAVRVHVPLKGATAARVDVFSTDQYLKVHFPPFLFEAFLFEPVNDDKSSAKISDGVAIFSLVKKSKRPWDRLMMMSCDKDTRRQLRERALKKHHDKLSSQSTTKMERRREEKKYLLETTMKLEREEADRIRKMKDAERETTTAELEAWQKTRKQTAAEEENNSNNNINSGVKATTARTRSGNLRLGSAAANCKKKEAELPAPRQVGNIGVTFTPRVFPTALRESRVAQEEEWLKKQAEDRRSVRAETGQEVMDIIEDEKNPDWLKDKGDRCFAVGDYLSAVNAYSAAIRLNRNMAVLFSNRAACHLKLRNLHKTIEDCSQALHLLSPPVAANAASRARAHVRRGAAFCELQLYIQGLQDYEAALKIHPDSEDLHRDTKTIRDMTLTS